MSLLVEFQAEIRSIGETQVISDKFQKREMIVKLIDAKGNEKYPTYFTIEAKQDNVVQFDNFAPDQVVDAKCFLSGRLWEPNDGRPEKAFVGLDLWEMKTAEGSPQGQSTQAGAGGTGMNAPNSTTFDDPGALNEDIPFAPSLT